MARAEVCDSLAEFLNYPVACKEVGAANTHLNQHEHPPLEEDLSPDLMDRFQSAIADENRLLVEQLLAGSYATCVPLSLERANRFKATLPFCVLVWLEDKVCSALES
eukprot:1444248-Amphidinium_carterae.1